MNIATIKGITSGEEAETVFVTGYNGIGAAINQYDVLCWDVASADGRTMTQPNHGSVGNFGMLAGVAQTTIGTDEYHSDVLRMGPTTCAVYGDSAVVPGVYLALVSARDYVAYGTAGQFAGSVAALQPQRFTCLGTQTTAQQANVKVYVDF